MTMQNYNSLHWSLKPINLSPQIGEFADERVNKKRFPAVRGMCSIRWRTDVVLEVWL